MRFSYEFMPRQGMYVRASDPVQPRTEEEHLPIKASVGLATVFITVPSKDEPIGTGFIGNYYDPVSRHGFLYLVTARHVIAGHEDDTHIRLRTAAKGHNTPGPRGRLPSHLVPVLGTEDVPCGPWSKHPERAVHEDIAVAPLAGLPSPTDPERVWLLSHLPIPSEPLGKVPDLLGDPIYYVGLLDHPAGLGERAQPVVRGGILAAWHQTGVELPMGDGTIRKPESIHIVDVRSWYGFSGSPCIIEWSSYWQPADVPRGMERIVPLEQFKEAIRDAERAGRATSPQDALTQVRLHAHHLTSRPTDLFGVLVSMGGRPRPRVTNEDISLSVTFRDPTGIAFVIPIERVTETLLQEDLMKERAERQRNALEEQERATHVMDIGALEADQSRPGPEAERLRLDGSLTEVSKRVLRAGRPDASEDREE